MEKREPGIIPAISAMAWPKYAGVNVVDRYPAGRGLMEINGSAATATALLFSGIAPTKKFKGQRHLKHDA